MTRTNSTVLGFALILGAMVFFGCLKREPSTSPPPSATGVDEAPMTAKQGALNAKEALFQRLSSELISALSSGGPTTAIKVCSQKAAEIAAAVGEEHRVAIGRTSFKLRNPANAPPEWAKPLVERRAAEPHFVDLPNGGTGALLPIRLQPTCLVCHGGEEDIAEDVQRQLTALYPEDTATGFSEGDLRGWFWVEVPAD